MKLIRKNQPYNMGHKYIFDEDSEYRMCFEDSDNAINPLIRQKKKHRVFINRCIGYADEPIIGLGTTFRRAVLDWKKTVTAIIEELQQAVKDLPDMPSKDEDIEIVYEDDEDYEDDAEIEERGK